MKIIKIIANAVINIFLLLKKMMIIAEQRAIKVLRVWDKAIRKITEKKQIIKISLWKSLISLRKLFSNNFNYFHYNPF